MPKISFPCKDIISGRSPSCLAHSLFDPRPSTLNYAPRPLPINKENYFPPIFNLPHSYFYECYFDVLQKSYDPAEPKTWKTVHQKCNSARNLSKKPDCLYQHVDDSCNFCLLVSNCVGICPGPRVIGFRCCGNSANVYCCHVYFVVNVCLLYSWFKRYWQSEMNKKVTYLK